MPAGQYLTGTAPWDAKAKLMAPAFKNDTSIATVAALQLGNLSSLSAADPRPLAGSPLLNKAEFTSTRINNAFFTKVTYAGAFDVNDNWMQGWTNFNPSAANY